MSNMSSDNRLSFANVPQVLYENRYCNQEGFSILACGGIDRNKKCLNQVLKVKVPSFEVIDFISMKKPHCRLKLTSIDSDIFIADYYIRDVNLGNSCTSVEIYSEETKTWKHQYANFKERYGFCLCSFMGKLYIFGGYHKKEKESRFSCYIYDIRSDQSTEIADFCKARYWTACTVFEGKIVATGGISKSDYSHLKSVEAYDHLENKWTLLPDMNEKRMDHAAVSMGNKLFVIGGDRISSCEIFDSFSRKFTVINSEITVSAFEHNYFEAHCIGSNIVIFHHSQSYKSVIYMYDVNKLKWLTVDCSYTKDYFVPSCLKYYVQ